jgi:hypothetical protein
MRTLRRILLIASLVVIAAGLAAPHLRANRLRPRIQAALEAALKRPVHIVKDVHLNLFTGPGFTAEQVLIDDDPASGIEPFANVDALRARVSLSSLLRGKLVFSSLYLDSPSVNLVKMPSGAWNIEPLLSHTSPGNGSGGGGNSGRRLAVPDIQISGGRLNFKFGDTKSVFYVSSADVDIYPNERGDVVIRFSGEPARTDRGSQSFGEISARGLLHSNPDGEAHLNMGLRLERTAISELVRLFNGRDFGMHGFTIADAQLDGPLSKLEISGNVNINDIHRWDLMPAKGDGWTLHYKGTLDLPGHQMDLATVASEGQPQPVSVKLHLADYLGAAKWSANVLFQDLPAASLVETARHMGAPLPAGIRVDGKVNGAIGYSNEQGPLGQVSLNDASLKFPDAGSASFDSAQVSIGNNAIVLAPVEMRSDTGSSAEIEGEYALDNSRAALRITTRQFTSRQFATTGIQSGAETVGATSIPLLEALRQGSWKGWIAFERKDEGAGAWSGEYELQNAVLDVPGLASPVRFQSASVRMGDGQIQISRIHARIGAMRLEGEYRYDPDARRPHHLRVSSPEVQLPELEKLMLPTLRHDEDGFFARTFRLRSAPLPKWLEERRVDASLDVGNVLIGDAPIGALQTHLLWDGPTLVLSDIACTLDRMSASGTVTLSLDQANPAYRLSGSVENLDYRSGQLDVDGELETKGIGEDLLLNVRSDGTFEGRGIALSADTLIREISGSYRITQLSGIPRLQLTNLQVLQGVDALIGQGASQADGHLVLDLASGRRQVHLNGMLLPIHLEPVAGR